MSYLSIRQLPEAPVEAMIMAFAGWPDAAEAATSTVKYISRKLQAHRFAELDPEEFYDFTQTRPHSSRARDGRRRVHWPANEFHYWLDKDMKRGLLTFVGVEPNLKWRTFSRTIVELAQRSGVKTVMHVGALLDAVPHSRDIRLTGSSNNPELQQTLDKFRIHSSNYQGPTGITSAVSEACTNLKVGYTSIWGHTAHYLQAAPNYRVSYTLAQTLTRLLDLPIDLTELQGAAQNFDREVAEAIEKDEQLKSYVKKLEERHDETAADMEIPEPADMVRELEQFLKAQRRRE